MRAYSRYLVLCCAALLAVLLLVLQSPAVGRAEYEHDFWSVSAEPDREAGGQGAVENDFWSVSRDAGQAASSPPKPPPAPAPDTEATEEERERPLVEIIPVVPKRYVVGDEQIQIIYRCLVMFETRIDVAGAVPVPDPFELIGIIAGERIAVPHEKDLEVQNVTVTVRVAAGQPNGTYRLPSFEVPYEYESVTGNERRTMKETAAVPAVEIEKVPLYVDVIQPRDTGFIGDEFPVTLEIHAGADAAVLNEFPGEEPERGIAYLSTYKPDRPFLLLRQNRQEFGSGQYRVISWHYTVTVHDVSDRPFMLDLPPVLWRTAGREHAETASREAPLTAGEETRISAAGGAVRTVSPEPVNLRIRSITAGSADFRPMKGVYGISETERFRLLTVPQIALGVLVAALALWLFTAAVHSLRLSTRKVQEGAFDETLHAVKHRYDRWPWQRIILRHRTSRAREAFRRNPGEETCSEFRALIARCAALRLKKKDIISVEEIRSMTAAELERITGESPETRELKAADYQLERGIYTGPLNGGRGHDLP